MRIWPSVVLTAVLIMGLPPSSAAQDLPIDQIFELFNTSRSDDVRASDDSELGRFGRLFAASLEPPSDLSSLRSQWRELGWELRAVEPRHLVLSEHPEQRRGRGFFVFDRDAESRLFVQAPHRLDDRSTGQLALDLLAAGAAVVGVSTVRRELVDLAHTERCELSSATAAFARATPGGTVLQLHGYAAAAHAGLSANDGVLSSSTSTPQPHLTDLQTCLADHAELRLAVFPADTPELGGTTNSQARVARRHGLRFRHLELDEATRARLRGDATLLPLLVSCMIGDRR